MYRSLLLEDGGRNEDDSIGAVAHEAMQGWHTTQQHTYSNINKPVILPAVSSTKVL